MVVRLGPAATFTPAYSGLQTQGCVVFRWSDLRCLRLGLLYGLLDMDWAWGFRLSAISKIEAFVAT